MVLPTYGAQPLTAEQKQQRGHGGLSGGGVYGLGFRGIHGLGFRVYGDSWMDGFMDGWAHFGMCVHMRSLAAHRIAAGRCSGPQWFVGFRTCRANGICRP